ncbi:MAG: hypothetical protein RQ966_14440 [Acetobacteraceae bacterium]|nr:hypothetical protein [Acetobacteraceae bacterium]
MTLLATGLALLPVIAFAAAPSPHVRGTVTSINGDTVQLKTDDGKTQDVKLSSGTKFIGVTKASLDKIDKNSYIGTATKDVGDKLVALEVVIFPEAMRGTGDGHYDWDPLPDHTQSGGSTVSSTMTNGNVSATSAPGGKVNSTMTNGAVSAESKSGGAKQLTVTYKGGEKQILVPPNVPVVMLAPGKRDEMKEGSHVVVTTAKDSNTANAIAVGLDGVTPPM